MAPQCMWGAQKWRKTIKLLTSTYMQGDQALGLAVDQEPQWLGGKLPTVTSEDSHELRDKAL